MNSVHSKKTFFFLIQEVMVKILLGLLLVILLFSGMTLAANASTVAQQSQANVSLNIKSDKQSFDLKTNTAIFTGDVIITRGNAIIKADKATLNKNKQGAETVDVVGNPVNFTSTLSNGKIVTGHSLQLHYDVTQDKITLTGNAYLKQDNNSIQGSIIHYSIKNEEMTASGNNKQQVSTVIIPNETSQSNTQNKVNDGKVSR